MWETRCRRVQARCRKRICGDPNSVCCVLPIRLCAGSDCGIAGTSAAGRTRGRFDTCGTSRRRGQARAGDRQRHTNSCQAYVGNGLNCVSCHLDARTCRVCGAARRTDRGLSGISRPPRPGRIPRRAHQRLLPAFDEGRALPPTSPEMIGLLAYIAWLSQGVPTGAEVIGRGFRDITAPAKPDPARGKALFAQKCTACHGAEGQGLRGAGNAFVFPPLWGPQSFNTGAGMARVAVAAAFVQAKMPLGNARHAYRSGGVRHRRLFHGAASAKICWREARLAKR